MELALQQEKAKQLRADIVKMTYLAKSIHPSDLPVRAARCLAWRC